MSWVWQPGYWKHHITNNAGPLLVPSSHQPPGRPGGAWSFSSPISRWWSSRKSGFLSKSQPPFLGHFSPVPCFPPGGLRAAQSLPPPSWSIPFKYQAPLLFPVFQEVFQCCPSQSSGNVLYSHFYPGITMTQTGCKNVTPLL